MAVVNKTKPAAAKKAPKATKAVKALHPSFKEMVIKAVGSNTDRKGISLIAIKQFIASNYKLNVELPKNKSFIKRNLVKLVDDKEVVQLTGTGASGSFKLPSEKKKAKKSAKPKQKKDEKAAESTEESDEAQSPPKKPKVAMMKAAK